MPISDDDWVVLGLAVAVAVTFASLLIRSRRYHEVAWVVHTTPGVSVPDVVRVVVEIANAGRRAADDVTVWTRTASAEDRLELARPSVLPGDGLALAMDVAASDWDEAWLEVRWRSPRLRRRPRTTTYHLATRTPPCPRREDYAGTGS